MAGVQTATDVVKPDPTSTAANESTNKFSPSKAAVQTEYIGSGAGYFTSKFSVSEESIKFFSPRAIESVKSIPVKVGATFTIAEYGCADGGTSMPLMYACVKELRSLYGNELEVHINYEDKLENDFKSLFYFLQGGRLALIVPVNDVDCNSSVTNIEKREDFVRNTPSSSPVYIALYKVWEGMAKDNIITEYELKEMTLPEYFRTHGELTKPFMSDESLVRKAGLTLVSMEIKEFPLPEKKLLQETGDAKLAARLSTEQIRAWTNSMFLSTLDGQPYSPEQKKDILNEYFYRLEEELLSSPEYYMLLTLWNAFIFIEKS